METVKQLKEARKIAAQQQGVISELQGIAKDIERCEKTVVALQEELQAVNVRHAERKTTQDDIHYLEDLLACAKKKLVWEKHIAALQKRTPDLMRRVEAVVNHPQSNPDEQTRAALLESLQNVKSAMDRLHGSKL